MKYILAALLCGLLILPLVGCQQSGNVNITASAAGTSSPASTSIQVRLTRVEQQLTDNDGQVLVTYAYDRPTITISGNTAAQNVIQGDLDSTIQTQLVNYAKEELLPQAQKSAQAGATDQLPLFSQLNFSVQRTDDTVISILTDRISDTGAAQETDHRSAKNYRTDSGEPLTFSMLGDHFQDTAAQLVSQQLTANGQDSGNTPVLDGTETAQVLYGSGTDTQAEPTYYLTNSAVVFLSCPSLSCDSTDILECPIPYQDFGDALDSAYLPSSYVPQSNDIELGVPSADSDKATSGFEAEDFLVSSQQVQGNGWTLMLPKEWIDQVYVSLTDDTAAFYENGCYNEMGGGWLFSLVSYTDDSYVDLPDYKLLSIDGGTNYVAIYPTDVQFEGASNKNAQRYSAFSNQVEELLRTFALSS